VDAKPSFIVKLNRADALIEGGAELEIGWLPPLLTGARNAKLAAGGPGYILANDGVQMLDVPSVLDRSKGDIHAAGNPHFVVDPENAKIIARHLADAFCALDAKGCDGYRANLKQFTDTLDAKLVEWQKALAPFKGQQVVAYHNSWIYFGNRFGLKVEIYLEPKPGIPPTPAHLVEVVTQMKAQNTRVIIVDPYLNRRTAEIGVRMALGAQRGQVLWMVLQESLVLCVMGAVIGLPLAFGMGRLLRSSLYGVGPADALTFIAAVVGVGAVALLSSWIPARRASSVDPMIALRYE
jgi:ABC-type Zn uptake system ZnuABC Zn-binding protein ZnuA